jgi:HlyD family secretion protein
LFLVAVAAAAGSALWYFSRPEPLAVALHTVGRGTVESTVANTRVGTVKACRRAYLAPAIPGQVSILNVTEGDRVEAEAILLEVWNEDLRAEERLAERESTAASARAREACASAAGAEREARRLERLFRDKLASEEAADIARTNADAKHAACEAARAATKVAEARIAVAQAAIERTIVRAPFPGIIAEVNAELGGFVTPSPLGIQTPPAIDLLDVSCLYVSAPIDEVDAPQIETGMRACVSLDAFPDRLCNGVVRRVAPYVVDTEKQARTVEVEVELNDPRDLAGLLPGYSADIEIALDAREDVLRVPTQAVLEGSKVLRYDPAGGRLEERDFEPGLRNWEHTEVRAGLVAGDRIVLSVGREGVEAGALVRPEQE